jgi:hypothetical protein
VAYVKNNRKGDIAVVLPDGESLIIRHGDNRIDDELWERAQKIEVFAPLASGKACRSMGSYLGAFLATGELQVMAKPPAKAKRPEA